MREPKRVVKVGGSLLRLADLPSRLEQWLSRQRPAMTLLVVGGGRLVDELRERQQAWGYSDEVAHTLALRCMDVNAAQQVAASPWLRLVRQWCPAVELAAGGAVVLECGDWAGGEAAFERSWRTTSDSIAAEIAGRVGAEELVLLKSALPAAAREQDAYVDPLFARHVPRGIAVRLVNLAEAGFPECGWAG